MPEIDKDTQKEIIKEAIKEWLDEMFTAFGKWSLGCLMAAAFGGVVYLALISQGWKK
jgi:hypothetical protein